MKSYGQVIGHVTEFVVTVLVCLFLGRFIDSHTGGGSKFVATGAILGFLGGTVRLALNLKKLMDRDPDGQDGGGSGGPG